MRKSRSTKRALIFSRQPEHLVALLVLSIALYGVSRIDGFFDGSFLGIDTKSWVVLNAGNAIAHQVYVWFCWRFQLHKKRLSRWFGPAAFQVYAVIFTILILARPILMTCLGISNQGSLVIDGTTAAVVSALLIVPVAYLGYSIKRYFGFERAFGIDHFDKGYRSMPLVDHGIFRFSPNAMYVFGFLILWIPGIWYESSAALALALFSHIYIWVHYFCTEKPDMEFIYNARDSDYVNR